MKSMTGFGQEELHDPDSGLSLWAEISSINRKQLEMRILLPPDLALFEVALRNLLAGKVSRGSLQLRLKVEAKQASSQGSPHINEPLVLAYLKKLENLRDKLDLKENISLTEILKLPGAVELGEPVYNPAIMEELLKKVTGGALRKLLEMREKEGLLIKTDGEKRLATLQTLLNKIKKSAKKIPELQKNRLLKRLAEMKLQLDANDDRILREMVIYTDRADVSEEIVRLESHFDQFAAMMANEGEPVGRGLDFLIQEMFREISTLGNKAAHANVTPLVVQFKTELEKIREQVQNIE